MTDISTMGPKELSILIIVNLILPIIISI